MTALRALMLTGVVLLAVVLQVRCSPRCPSTASCPTSRCSSWSRPPWCRGPEFAAVLGFLGGLAIDLAPPTDHVAGRWALALVVVGYLAGRVRQDAGSSAVAAVLTVAACSFVGTSVFALSGMLLHDPAIPVGEALAVIPVAVLYDVLVTPFVLPLVMRLFRRLQPHQVAY